MVERAKRIHFTGFIKPIKDPLLVSGSTRIWTTEEMNQIRLGIIPTGMDQRWIAFMEVNTLYLHQSSTGCCVYEIRFREVESGLGHIIDVAYVTNDKSIYSCDTNNETERIAMEKSIRDAYYI